MGWRGFPGLLKAAGLTWMLGIVLGLTVFAVPDAHVELHKTQPAPTAWGIFSTNLRVLAGCLLGLVTFSLASFATLMLNGILLGIQWRIFTAHESGWKVLALIAPHGVLEIPGMLLAGAVGMMGAAALRCFVRTRAQGIRCCALPAMAAVAVSLVLTLLGALVEAWNIARL